MYFHKIIGFLIIFSLSIQAAIATEKDISIANSESSALLNYSTGRYKEAIQDFRKLKRHYKKVDDAKYIKFALLNALSLDAIGVPIEACESLHQIVNATLELCDPSSNSINYELKISTQYQIISAITLANLLRDLGSFEKSKKLLKAAELAASQLNNDKIIAGIEIGYGNLDFVKLKLRRDRLTYQSSSLPSSKKSEIDLIFNEIYQRYESAFNSPLHREAISKWLTLHEEHRKWLPLLETSTTYNSKYKESQKKLNELANLPDSSESTEIELAKLKIDLAHHFYNFGISRRDQQSLASAFKFSKDAIGITNSAQLESEAFGIMGNLYTYANQNILAIEAFKSAADRSNHPYAWKHKQAQIYEKLGKQKEAIDLYESSILDLKKIEWNVKPATAEIRLNWQEQTKPIYDNYLKLLLSQGDPDFRKILQINQDFASSELQNYLGCSSLEPIESAELFQQDQNAVVLNIFKSGDYYHTIAQNSETIEYSRTPASNIDRNLSQSQFLVNSIQNSVSEARLKNNLTELYDNLVRPVESLIQGNETLLFALDSNLQQISIGMLFDGDRYLIEKNPVALITPQLYNPKELSQSDKNTVFFAGISEVPDQFSEFSPLPHVSNEVKFIGAQTVLINQDFTKNRLMQNLTTEQSVFHIASHGQFSSNPNETFLLSWDKKISLESLSSVVGDRAQNTPNPIELLVLSACESAKGDVGAFLGLAGISVQSGARSTVASLWQVEDESAALLMADFYKFLRSGESKAKALQLAQIEQIKQGQLPNYWGGFVLVGSWL